MSGYLTDGIKSAADYTPNSLGGFKSTRLVLPTDFVTLPAGQGSACIASLVRCADYDEEDHQSDIHDGMVAHVQI